MNISSVFVEKNLFLNNPDTLNSKRIRRYLKKNKLQIFFSNKHYKSDFNICATSALMNFLIDTKHILKNKKLEDRLEYIGILTDHVHIKNNICILPKLPRTWDIVCLDNDITSYNFKNENNNTFWTSTKIADSRNFVLNVRYIDTIIDILKRTKTWVEFMEELRIMNTEIFSMTKYNLSIRMDNWCENDNKKICHDKFSNTLSQIQTTNYTNLVNQFETKFKMMKPELKSKLFPSVTLLCIAKDKDSVVQSICSFMKLNYPRDKLELLIMDDNNFEKSIREIIPNDTRIKIIKIDNKSSKEECPLGYKLNMGVKYASHQIIFHLFDTNIYFLKNFENLIKCFVMSGKDVLMSRDTAYLNNSISKMSDLSNMIYTKNFWNTFEFDNNQSDEFVLLTKFLLFRINCANFLPFVYFSIKNREPSNIENLQELPFNLTELLE